MCESYIPDNSILPAEYVFRAVRNKIVIDTGDINIGGLAFDMEGVPCAADLLALVVCFAPAAGAYDHGPVAAEFPQPFKHPDKLRIYGVVATAASTSKLAAKEVL